MAMHLEIRQPRIGVVAVLAALCFLPTASRASDIFYSGQATGVEGQVSVGDTDADVLLANIGMSCQGLPREETLASISNPAPIKLASQNVHVYTLGKDGKAVADATMGNLNVSVEGINVSAQSVGSHARAVCDVASGNVTLSGHSDYTNVTVNGQSIDPRTKRSIQIPNVGYVYFDQHRNYGNEMRVYAIHIRVDNPSTSARGDVYIGKTRAKTICNP
jgi:hypothetical protein